MLGSSVLSSARDAVGRWPLTMELPCRRSRDEVLTSQVAHVNGRPARLLVGGEGLPVLFLHGWGLGPRAYSTALRRLVDIGCRVYVPALPGFGGSADLPRRERSMAGYGDWAAAFLATTGVAEPVFVLGHSFGGGVAIQLAHDHPDLVSYLVLLNSVGGASLDDDPLKVHLVDDRPPWRWAFDFGREVLPSRSGLQIMRAMKDDLSSNVLLNPLAMMEIGMVARRADLRPQLAALGRRQLPVLALWSDDDHVIPSTSFDALCAAIGTDGQVVGGRHSWLLADADAFSEVLGNVVEVQVAEHGARTAVSTAAQIRSLLASTSMPRRMANQLLAGAPPLWLMSEPAAVLAGDLALCHPRLAKGEVRAVARPVESSTSVRLTVVARDRPGLLADTAALLAAEGLPVTSASAVTWGARSTRRIALHAMTFSGGSRFDDERWSSLGLRLRSLGDESTTPWSFAPTGRATVTSTEQATGRAIVTVTAPDQLGLLSTICRWFADHDVSIEAATARTARGMAQDHFVVAGTCDPDELARHLSARVKGRTPAPTLVTAGAPSTP